MDNISPLAKRLAEENNVDWQQLTGTGPDRRIVERDVLLHLTRVMTGRGAADPTPTPDLAATPWPDAPRDPWPPSGHTPSDDALLAPDVFSTRDNMGDSERYRDAFTAARHHTPQNTMAHAVVEDTFEDDPSASALFIPDALPAPTEATSETSDDDSFLLTDETDSDKDDAFDFDTLHPVADLEFTPDSDESLLDLETHTAKPVADDILLDENNNEDDNEDAIFLPINFALDHASEDTLILEPLDTHLDIHLDNKPIHDEPTHDEPTHDEASANEVTDVLEVTEASSNHDERHAQASPFAPSPTEFLHDEATSDEHEESGPEDVFTLESNSAYESLAMEELPHETPRAYDQAHHQVHDHVHDQDGDVALSDADPVAAPAEPTGTDDPTATEGPAATVAEPATRYDDVPNAIPNAAPDGGTHETPPADPIDPPVNEAVVQAIMAQDPALLPAPPLVSSYLEATQQASETTPLPYPNLPLANFGLLLRLTVDLTALGEAQLAVAQEFGENAPYAPTVFLLRAAAKAIQRAPLGDDASVALATFSKAGLGATCIERAATLPLRELLAHTLEAQMNPTTTLEPAALVVADMSAYALDEVVLNIGTPVLSLGRITHDSATGTAQGSLLLSGGVAADTGAAFLNAVAELLASPVRLIL